MTSSVPKNGRKLQLDDVYEEFVELVGQGHYYDTVCKIVGISRTTFYRYMQYGLVEEENCPIRDDGQRVYPDGVHFNPRFLAFREDVERASAQAEFDTVNIVRTPQQDFRTGLTNMDPLMWWLERRFPHKYGRRVTIEDAEAFIHTGDDVITPDQMERIGQATIEQARTMRQLEAITEDK